MSAFSIGPFPALSFSDCPPQEVRYGNDLEIRNQGKPQPQILRDDALVLVAPAKDRDDRNLRDARTLADVQRVLETVAETGRGRHLEPGLDGSQPIRRNACRDDGGDFGPTRGAEK